MTGIGTFAIDFEVAIVDSVGDWGLLAETQICSLPRTSPARLFGDASRFLDSQLRFPSHVPLVLIADSAAVSPDVSQGIFARAREVVPRCRMLYYPVDPQPHLASEFLKLGGIKMIRRDSKDSFNSLKNEIDDIFGAFRKSLICRLIMKFQEDLNTTPYAHRSGIDGDDDNELAPINMLIEIARGTPAGQEYLHHLLPLSKTKLPSSSV
jgi:hypothetical protein